MLFFTVIIPKVTYIIYIKQINQFTIKLNQCRIDNDWTLNNKHVNLVTRHSRISIEERESTKFLSYVSTLFLLIPTSFSHVSHPQKDSFYSSHYTKQSFWGKVFFGVNNKTFQDTFKDIWHTPLICITAKYNQVLNILHDVNLVQQSKIWETLIKCSARNVIY